MKREELSTIFVTGYAQAPKGTRLFDAGHTIGVMLEIEKKTHIIVNADCTFVTDLARDYFKRLIVGYNLLDDIETIIELVKVHIFIPSTQSMIVALRITHQRYVDSISR